MRFVIGEIVGLFLIIVGAGAVVGAGWLVDPALGILAAGLLLLLIGVLVVYVAAVLEQRARAEVAAAATARRAQL